MRRKNLVLERSIHGGVQRLYRFDNGLGASVVRHQFSYGNEDGLWEMGLIRWEGEKFGLVYDNEKFFDVISNLTNREVNLLLEDISKMKELKVEA